MSNRNEIEKRALAGVELRAEAGKLPVIVGYAALFNSFSQDLGGFKEIIRPGAFKRCLASGCEILAFGHHDTTRPLARRSAGTLSLVEDERGLRVEIQTADTSHARDCVADITAKNIEGMSFGFRVVPNGDRWSDAREGGQYIRELLDVDLIEVSPVSMPAYVDTSVSIRTKPAKPSGVSLELIREAASKLAGIYVRLISLPIR